MAQQNPLKHAAALLQAGKFPEALALCDRLLKDAPRHPDTLHLAAMAAWKSGDPATAEQRFRTSLDAAPGQPAVLANFGDFLMNNNRTVEAEASLRDAIRHAPDFVPAWYRLAKLLLAQRRFEPAAKCAHRVTTLTPGDVSGWELRAAIEQQRGSLSEAIAICRDGLAAVPKASRLHYALAQLLREDCAFAESVETYESARLHGFDHPDLYRNQGEAHIEAGDCDGALACFAAGIERFPQHASLHRLRARLHWEYGVAGDPLAELARAARAAPRNAELWELLADLLNRLGRTAEVGPALAEARQRGCPETATLKLLDAIGTAAVGDRAKATALFTALVADHPSHDPSRLAFAAHLLTTAEPARAEAECAAVLANQPHSQLAWAYRGTAWQLLADPRADWLLDYDRMVMPIAVPPPDGVSTDAFFATVRTALESMHRMRAHPIDQTLRGGTQTNGFLFRYKDPVVRALEAQIRIALRDALSAAPRDDAHPFWGRRGERRETRFAGAWSVRLQSQGFHTNHIHPQGWISSALYISLPSDLAAGGEQAGYIQFGVPPEELGLTVAPGRVVEPKVGTLLLFPSYMWHGTVPFTSTQPRITVAFDLLPE